MELLCCSKRWIELNFHHLLVCAFTRTVCEYRSTTMIIQHSKVQQTPRVKKFHSADNLIMDNIFVKSVFANLARPAPWRMALRRIAVSLFKKNNLSSIVHTSAGKWVNGGLIRNKVGILTGSRPRHRYALSPEDESWEVQRRVPKLGEPM